MKIGSMTPAASNGIVTLAGHRSVDATVAKVKALLEAKNVKLFALIDHSGEALKAGMKMPNTKLMIFGNPAGGTPAMLAAPTLALDLPLKILVWEDGEARVWVSYNSVEYLVQRHKVPVEKAAKLFVIETLAAKAAE
jgi:uncharacterized protein (DUF302 family)